MRLGLAFLFTPLAASAAEPIATTPHMGWNNGDSYGTSVTEAEVKATERALQTAPRRRRA